MEQETGQETRGKRKVRTGEVVKTGAQKSVIVAIRSRVRHPEYGKIIKRTSKIMVHDENGDCAVGDLVRVMETRPLSKRKRWRYLETVRKAD